MATEIEEVQNLLEQATFPGIKSVLQSYLSTLQTPPVPAPVPSPVPSRSEATIESQTLESSSIPEPELRPVKIAVSSGSFVPLEDFAWEQGSYNSPTITIYIDLENVGSVKDQVVCNFGRYSFDLTVTNLHGKNYRLVKDNLEKDIIPDESKCIVKKNKIVLKLAKVKGEYSYESWNQLTAKKPRDPTEERKKKEDPQSSLMDMMKDMYESGDENMKKVIGEAMMKSQMGGKP